MKSFQIILISAALVAFGECRTVGEAPAGRVFSMNDLMTKAQTDLAKLGKELHSNLNIPNQETFVATLQDQSANFVNNVKSYMNQMTEAMKAKSPEIGKAWAGMKETLNKVTDEITAQIPKAKEQAAQLEAKFINGVNTMVKQSELVTQTVSKSSGVIQDDIFNIVKKAIESAVETAAQLSSQSQQHAAGAKPKA